MSLLGRVLCIALAAVAIGCGEETEAVIITATFSYDVPAEIDGLHFALSDDAGIFIERTFALTPGAREASLTLTRGSRTPKRLRLVVYAMLGSTVIAQSAATSIVFAAGETREQRLTL